MPFTLDATAGLPSYARADLAWQETKGYPSAAATGTFTYTTRPASIDLIYNVFLLLNCDATVATRVPYLTVFDQDGGRLALQAGTLGATASVQAGYTWNVASTSASNAANVFDTEPLPLFQFLPGYSLTLNVLNAAAGDTMTRVALAILHIPTGPARDSQSAALVPTPLIA